MPSAYLFIAVRFMHQTGLESLSTVVVKVIEHSH